MTRHLNRRVMLAVAALSAVPALPAFAAGDTQLLLDRPPVDLQWLSSLARPGSYTIRRVTSGDSTAGAASTAGATASPSPITAFPLSSPPVNGFQAMMVVSLTDAQDHNDF